MNNEIRIYILAALDPKNLKAFLMPSKNLQTQPEDRTMGCCSSLGNIPIDVLIPLNHTTFLQMDDRIINNEITGTQYDTNTNTWNEWNETIPFSQNYSDSIRGVAYDIKHEMLYICTISSDIYGDLISFNMNTKLYTIYK